PVPPATVTLTVAVPPTPYPPHHLTHHHNPTFRFKLRNPLRVAVAVPRKARCISVRTKRAKVLNDAYQIPISDKNYLFQNLPQLYLTPPLPPPPPHS
ncbi:hypothetical protein M0804_015524, partial [Polistes exclamans]